MKAIARTGLAAVLLHPLRSAVTVSCVVCVLLPYLAGTGIARGLLDQAGSSVEHGADLYVTGTRFGRAAPLPLAAVADIAAVPGVRDAYPRIVGEVLLGRERVPAVLVGMPAPRVPARARFVEGELFGDGPSHEFVFGAALARRLGLAVGARLPPFYRNAKGERVSRVVGIFHADLPVWEANLVFCSFETAAFVFDDEEATTSVLVDCLPDSTDAVKRRLLKMDLRPTVTSRDDLRVLLPRRLGHLHGIFNLHFVLVFAVGIPLLLVTSGVGLAERRREAALLKATGWMTDEVMLRGMVESAVLALLGASVAVLGAWAWLALGNGAGIAGVFLPGADLAPAFTVPFRLAPGPALIGFAVSFAIVSTGTLYSTWRAATAAPAVAMR